MTAQVLTSTARRITCAIAIELAAASVARHTRLCADALAMGDEATAAVCRATANRHHDALGVAVAAFLRTL
jgi:hypothetical protein